MHYRTTIKAIAGPGQFLRPMSTHSDFRDQLFFDKGTYLLAHYVRRRIVAYFGIQVLRARIDIERAHQYLAVMQGEGFGFQYVPPPLAHSPIGNQ